MATPEDFRIQDVRQATLNGLAVKLFAAFKRSGDVFIYAGQFSAPTRTADEDLWKVAASHVGDEVTE